MSPFQIILNDRATQLNLPEQLPEPAATHQNPFNNADSSDSDTETPKVRAITSLSAARPQPAPQKPSPAPLPEPPARSGPKESQIARLLARRKDAAGGLANEAREARDDALFRYDVDRCEEEASAVAYEKRPVEGFGEILLRSMGWHGKTAKGDAKEPTPRPARLGLGAKAEDLPPAMKGKRPRGRANGVADKRGKAEGGFRPDSSAKDGERRVGERRDGERRNEESRDGVTAESSHKTEAELRRKERFTGQAKQQGDVARSTGRRRLKRSRFMDDPGR